MCSKNLLLFLILILYSLCGFAQVKISGKVKDCDDVNLAYVTVRLLNLDSTFVKGTVTDTLGYYQFSDVPKNNYLLAYSTIGYKSQIIPIKVSDEDVNIHLITLDSDNVLLGEVVVKASSYVRKDDHILVVPDKQQIKHANTGYDLLYNLMIPTLNVDKRKGKVTILGSDVALYINGEKADYNEVKNLRPRDIENVEYYDVPIGKYADDIAAINYITKIKESGGYVSADGSHAIGYLSGDYNVSTKIMRGNVEYSFLGGYKIQKYNGVKTDKMESILFPEYNIDRKTLSESGIYKNNRQYFQFKINKRTKKYKASVLFSLERDETPHNESLDNLNYSGRYIQTVSSLENISEEGLSPALKLYNSINLPKQQTLEMTARASYSQNKYTRIYMENEQRTFTDVDEDLCLLDLDLNYNIKLKNKSLFGIKAKHTHKITSSTYAGDYVSWQHLWTGNSKLVLNYNQQIGKRFNLILSSGASLLSYKLHRENLNKQWFINMNSYVVYKLNKNQQLMWAVNFGNSQPNINLINNVSQIVDFFQIKRGNPDLDNTKVYQTAVAYNANIGRLNMQIAGQYMRYQDNIFENYYIEGDKMISSYASDMNINQWGALLDMNYRFSDKLRSKLNILYFHTETSGMYNYWHNRVHALLDINYFWKNFSFNVYGSSTKNVLNISSLTKERKPLNYGMSVSWTNKGWYVEAGTENPFNKNLRYKEYAMFDIYKYNQIQTCRINQQTAYVKLAYTFDFGKETSREKKDESIGIENGILKR